MCGAATAAVTAGRCARTLPYVEAYPANLKLVEQLLARRIALHLLCASDGNLGIEYNARWSTVMWLLPVSLHLPPAPPSLTTTNGTQNNGCA